MTEYQTRSAEELAGQAPKRKRAGRWWRIPCPAHGGEGLNLALRDSDRPGAPPVAVCHSRGCDYRDILDALGVAHELPDYRGQPHHVRTYYTASGEARPVYRTDGPRGKRVWGDGSPVGALVSLWPAPDADGGELVVLVEGEKAAAAVQAAGFTAASWRGGASAVAGADFSPLAGRDVLLWPDADDQGRRAMETAAAALAAHGATARVLEAAGDTGEDAADLSPAAIAGRIEEGGQEPPPPAPDPDFPYGHGAPDPLSWQAHAERLLRESPARMLVVWEPQRRASLRILQKGGTWGDDVAAMKRYMTAASDRWIAKYLRTTKHQAAAAMRSHRAACSEDGVLTAIKDVNYAAERARHEREPIPGLTECEQEELDGGLYLGTPEGVVDLDTGNLLSAAEGRTKLVTMRTAVPLELEARDERVDALTAHLDPADETYLWGVFARVLTGRPLGFIAIMGETNAGKSTLVNAIAGALGEYAHQLSPAVIAAGRGESVARPELEPLAKRRLVHLEESVRDGATVSAETVKRYWDAGSRVSWRRLYSNIIHDAPVTATLALSFNSMTWADGKGASAALLRRMRTLVYPNPPADRGPDYKRAVESDPACQRAVLARLVRTGLAHGWQEPPPGPGVEASKRAQRAATVGEEVADWIDANVVRDPDARLWSGALWDAAGKADLGLPRKELAQAVAQYLGLNASVSRRRPETGKKERCWQGARLASEPEQAALTALDEGGPKTIIIEHDGNELEVEMPGGDVALEPLRLAAENRTRAIAMADELIRQGGRLLPPERDGQEPLPVTDGT